MRTAYPSHRLQAAAAREITEEVDLENMEVVEPPESGLRSSSSSIRPPMMMMPGCGGHDADPPTLLTKVPRFVDEYFDADEVIEDLATRVKRDAEEEEAVEAVEDQLTRVRKPVSLTLPPPPPPPSKPRVRTPSGHSISNQRVAFPAPQFSAPLQPKPFVPVSPITQPTLVDQEMETPQQLSRPKLPTPATITEAPSASESLVSVSPQALPPTVRRSPSGWNMDMSSIAPVAMPAAQFNGRSRMADRTVQLRPQKPRSPAVTFFLIVIGLLIGGVVGVLVMVPGAYDRARTTASGYVDHIVGARPRSEPTVSMPSLDPVPPPPPVMPVPPALLDNRPYIENDMTIVTFSPSAKGHRIYIDGKLTTLTGDQPTKLKCGMHTIRIGGVSKTKTVDLPCGRDVILAD